MARGTVNVGGGKSLADDYIKEMKVKTGFFTKAGMLAKYEYDAGNEEYIVEPFDDCADFDITSNGYLGSGMDSSHSEVYLGQNRIAVMRYNDGDDDQVRVALRYKDSSGVWQNSTQTTVQTNTSGGGQSYSCQIAKIDKSHFAIAYDNDTTIYVRVYSINLSSLGAAPSSVDYKTISSVEFSGDEFEYSIAAVEKKITIIYSVVTSEYPRLLCYNLDSSFNMTTGTVYSIADVISAYSMVVMPSSNKAFVVFDDDTNNLQKGLILDISDIDNISGGTITTLQSARRRTYNGGGTHLYSKTEVALYTMDQYNSINYLLLIDISGATPNPGTAMELAYGYGAKSIVVLNRNMLLTSFGTGSYLGAYEYPISGTTISVGTKRYVSNSDSYPHLVIGDDNNSVHLFGGPSGAYDGGDTIEHKSFNLNWGIKATILEDAVAAAYVKTFMVSRIMEERYW